MNRRSRVICRSRQLAGLVLAMSLGACGQPATSANHGPLNSHESVDTTQLQPSPGCTSNLAVAKLQALFDAFNKGDAHSLVAMFPEPGSEAFVIQPELEFSAVPPFPPGDIHKASNPDELRALIQAAAGYRLSFAEPPRGWAKRIDYFVNGQKKWVWTAGVSEVRWQAVGPSGTFGGATKVAFNCESGKFLRVLL